MCIFFFFNDTATTEIYTLSLHDALPISRLFFAAASSIPPRTWRWANRACSIAAQKGSSRNSGCALSGAPSGFPRSEEHTSELQSHLNLVCRLLLEKKKYMLKRNLAVHCA